VAHTLDPSLTMCPQFYESLRPPHSPAKLLMTGLFAYLVNDIDAARKVIHRHMDLLPVETCAMEEAYQFLCKLLYVHCSRHPAPASLARETLEIAISSYPDNTLLLSLYLWGEMGGRVYGRVQSLVSKLSSASGDGAGVIGHLWSVWAEAMSAHRTFWDKGGGGAERVRNALDRGINSIL